MPQISETVSDKFVVMHGQFFTCLALVRPPFFDYTCADCIETIFDTHGPTMDELRTNFFSRALLLCGTAALILTMLIAGCAGEQTTRVDYETQIQSSPEGAAVENDRGVMIGQTPVSVDGEVDVTTRRSRRARLAIGTGLALSGLMIPTTFFDAYDHGQLDGTFVAMVLTSIGSLALAAWGQWGMTSSRNVYLRAADGAFDGDVYAGKLEDHNPEHFLEALPATEFNLSAPGHTTRRATLDLGADSSVRLKPRETPSTAVASADHATEPATPEPTQPQTDDEQPSFVTGAPQPNVHALVVGIEEYRSITDTPGARGDAERFAEMLETSLGVPTGNIHLLTDDEATRGDVLAKLELLQRTVPSDGRIYFYFSGHGTPDVESGDSFVLPFEGRPETLEHTAIAMDDILDSLKQSEARDILAFVDACFSGSGDRSALPEGTRPLVPVEQTESSANVAFFSSSAASEISGNAPDAEEGLFTRHVIRAIGEGRADIDGDGQISLAELETYVSPRVERQAQEANRNQTPTLDVAEELGDPSNIMVIWGLPRD